MRPESGPSEHGIASPPLSASRTKLRRSLLARCAYACLKIRVSSASPACVGYAESGPGDLVQRNNVLENSGAFQTRGAAFDPSIYYSYAVENPAGVPVKVMANAGFGKIDPWKAAGVAPF